MNLDDVSRQAQACFQAKPTIILGSGASMPQGLPSMGDLRDYLLKNLEVKGEVEEDPWLLVRADLANGDHLEAALDGKNLPTTLLHKIVRCTWECINEKDLTAFHAASSSHEAFPLGKLLSGVFASTHEGVHVVTTNYDRVAEYACNSVGLLFQTGFAPGYVQKWESTGGVHYRHGGKASRVVRIWKVHGSLDWFQSKEERIIGLPVFSLPSLDYTPLIVTPGLNKYEKTSEDPFRTTINGADRALRDAPAFLCIGFGFRDKHIHPKIIERCREENVPIVVLARTLTEEAKQFLKTRAGSNYLGIERDGDRSRVYTATKPDGLTLDVSNLWSLDGFNKVIL